MISTPDVVPELMDALLTLPHFHFLLSWNRTAAVEEPRIMTGPHHKSPACPALITQHSGAIWRSEEHQRELSAPVPPSGAQALASPRSLWLGTIPPAAAPWRLLGCPGFLSIMKLFRSFETLQTCALGEILGKNPSLWGGTGWVLRPHPTPTIRI